MSNGSEAVVARGPHDKEEIAEEIIYSTEVIEEEEEEVVEEVEEIIEIIEEIEEIEEILEEEEILDEAVPSSTQEVETENPPSENYSVIRDDDENQNDSAHEDDPGVIPQRFKNAKQYRSKRSSNRRSYGKNKKIIAYDAHEDWEDEENDQHHQIAESRAERRARNNSVDSPSQIKKNHSLNGKRSASARDDDFSSPSNRSNAEPVYKAAKTRAATDYTDSRNTVDSNDMEEIEEEEEVEEEQEMEEEEEEEEEDNQHEIVKSAENNLVYTVLGSKKGNSGAKAKRDSASNQNQENASYMKMERLDEDTIPVEGTMYYEGDNMETVYLAQSVNDGTDEYQYEEQIGEQEDQQWEAANEGTVEEHEDEEGVQQDQIFLHEDENGQLYFKDDNGQLQPVYLTADGNYAIAENSGDEQEAHENTNNRQQGSPSSSTSAQVAKNFEEDSFIVPELEGVASGSNTNDPDNEDNNTVTISLIISEDENGQKRTQVIIPTTDNLKCELCAKTFKTPFQLLRHNRLKHAREEDITTRNFPCDLCPKRYSDQNTLARHRKTHIGDRPFGCLECGKSFPTSTALRRHLTQHNPQSRPLPCIYCGRRFLEKSALTKHEQSHLAGDQRTHTCDICHKSFLQAADLNLHKKNHDPDKKFDCEVCGREFNRLNNLQRHMMVHKQKQGQNQEILACDVCGITYKFMSSLTRHMVTSHMNPEKLRQQAEEQRKKRENNYRRYLENRKMYETQHTGSGYVSGGKRGGSGGYRSSNDNDEDTA